MDGLEVVYGESRRPEVARQLEEAIRDLGATGTLYLGYPVLSSADERVHVDALLVSGRCGLVAFLIADDAPPSGLSSNWAELEKAQNRLYAALESYLGRHESLRRGRRLAFAIETITVLPNPDAARPAGTEEGHYCGLNGIQGLLQGFKPLEDDIVWHLQAALQRVVTIKPPKKRGKVRSPQSRGAILKTIEQEIANLDRWQKRAAIETPEGPQRVRGLAGSGKTIVLALKAAYLHAQHPDWKIGVTFHTRSLYQQFEDLIRRFSFEHLNDEPDWDRLNILHAWGSADRMGVYRLLANHLGATPRDWGYATATYGIDDAFQGVCNELVAVAASADKEPIFDAVLVDEAQDLPPAFFRLLYRFTRTPKRIVWAYDELQKLSGAPMPSTDELFGLSPQNKSLVQLANHDGEPRQDIILPVCYRNPPWTLTVAHALGFGIYRPSGLVQHFDEPTLWEEVGYRVRSGTLSGGQPVELERSPDSYPMYFKRMLQPTDAVSLHSFDSDDAQVAWLAECIKRNLREDELDFDDILIVLPNAYTSKRRAQHLISVLGTHGVVAHHAGVTTDRDSLFQAQSVAIAHIHRAKGNEAPVVYVIDSEHAADRFHDSSAGLATRRNVLFTAITRSRAWVRISGVGPKMQEVESEYQKVIETDYALKFRMPTETELAKIRQIHRDRTIAEQKRMEKAQKGLEDFIQALEEEAISVEQLPPEMRTRLAELIRRSGAEIDDPE